MENSQNTPEEGDKNSKKLLLTTSSLETLIGFGVGDEENFR